MLTARNSAPTVRPPRQRSPIILSTFKQIGSAAVVSAVVVRDMETTAYRKLYFDEVYGFDTRVNYVVFDSGGLTPKQIRDSVKDKLEKDQKRVVRDMVQRILNLILKKQKNVANKVKSILTPAQILLDLLPPNPSSA